MKGVRSAIRGPRRALVALPSFLLLASVGCSGLAPASPTPPPSPRPVATLALASSPASEQKSGGKVTVYSALSETCNAAIVAAFEAAQPVIGIEVLSLAAAGDLESHIRAEKTAPRADVFLGGSSEYHDSLAQDGLLEAYRSPQAAAVDLTLKDPDGFWTGWYLGIFGILLNTDRWAGEMQGKLPPATWDDLLDPSYRGKLAMPDPETTGGGYIFLANQVFRFNRDETKAMDYMKKLHANVGQYTTTSPLTIDLVGKGEFLAGLNWGHDVVTAAEEGQPLRFVAPEDTAVEVGAVSIVKGGPNPRGAAAFVDWVLSEEAARVVVKLSNRISVLKRVGPAPGAPSLETVKLAKYDRTWATENRDRLLWEWRAAVGR